MHCRSSATILQVRFRAILLYEPGDARSRQILTSQLRPWLDRLAQTSEQASCLSSRCPQSCSCNLDAGHGLSSSISCPGSTRLRKTELGARSSRAPVMVPPDHPVAHAVTCRNCGHCVGDRSSCRDSRPPNYNCGAIIGTSCTWIRSVFLKKSATTFRSLWDLLSSSMDCTVLVLLGRFLSDSRVGSALGSQSSNKWTFVTHVDSVDCVRISPEMNVES